jgi:hypothetical protein
LVLKEKVDYTIGHCNTGGAMTSLDVFQDHKHLLMVPCSTGSAVTTKYKPADSTIFRVAAPDSRQSAVPRHRNPRPTQAARGGAAGFSASAFRLTKRASKLAPTFSSANSANHGDNGGRRRQAGIITGSIRRRSACTKDIA